MELARERIWGELEKGLMKAEKPSIFFETLREMNQLKDWFPELENLIGVPQNPMYHPEGDVWNHTMLVIDEAAKLKFFTSNPKGFMLTAVCHDFGKAITTEEVDGKIRALEHETKGLPLVEAFLDRIVNENDTKKYVMNMVELHMRPNILASSNCKKKVSNKMFDVSICPNDLILFAKADHFGRLNPPSFDEIEDFLNERLKWFDEVMSKPEVMGKDLIEAGLKPSPKFTQYLEFAHKLHLSNVKKEQALNQILGEIRNGKL